MSAPERHESDACTLAWHTLRLAHDRVAAHLGAALAEACALAINEFDVLLYLHAHAGKEVRAGALRDAVALSQPALSRLVARLEARGLLGRSPAAADGRATIVCLTEAGAALLARAIPIHAAAVHETLTGKFTPAERETLLRILGQIGR